MSLPPDRIYSDLATVLQQTFPDREYSGTVDANTRVFADLGLASIEVVVLAEKLEGYYGQRLPFGPFLMELRNRGVEDLELGELVDFLQKHING